MKKIVLLLMVLVVYSSSCQSKTKEKYTAEQMARIEKLRSEITDDVRNNVLAFWKTHSVDYSENGGFYGAMTNDGSPRENVARGNVLNARLIWTFSADYRLFKDEKALELANRAQRYFIDNFIDKEYGGCFWSVRPDGSPADDAKQTYGIAFGIYGLSEHYRATGNQESLDKAIELYNTLEKYAYDPQYGGYIESFTRDWQKPAKYGYDGDGTSPKSMNTHLHVLEAYTNLYRVWPDKGLYKQLKALTEIAAYTILNHDTWHEMLYFTMDWQNKSNIDSYGHDIEYSWLLDEAGKVLGDEELLKDIQRITVKVAEVQLQEGITKEGAMISERHDGKLSTSFSWWPQAESVVGFMNAFQISGDEKFLDASINAWEWIKAHMIDHEYGEWYGTVSADGTPFLRGEKGSMWRCPYHNSRSGFEIYERFEN